jgi:hypothetical protein
MLWLVDEADLVLTKMAAVVATPTAALAKGETGAFATA